MTIIIKLMELLPKNIVSSYKGYQDKMHGIDVISLCVLDLIFLDLSTVTNLTQWVIKPRFWSGTL